MKITLREIAAKSGLSITVLSRVLNGNGYVSDEKRARAQAALSQAGYVRCMPHKKSITHMDDMILVISGSTGHTYQQTINALSEAARKASLKLLVAPTQYNATLEDEYLRFAQRAGMYGVVMLSAPERKGTARLIRESAIPIVMVARYMSMISTDVVTQDSYEMGILAAKLLMRQGHKDLAFLGGHIDSSITRDKQRGFTDQLEESGLCLDPRFVSYGSLDYQSGFDYVQQLLTMEHAPTALFASNDLMAMGVVDALLQAGCSVPRDLSLICCDKTLASDTFHVPLDRLYIDWNQTANMTIHMLSARKNNPSLPRRLCVFDTQFASGQSISSPRERASLLPAPS